MIKVNSRWLNLISIYLFILMMMSESCHTDEELATEIKEIEISDTLEAKLESSDFILVKSSKELNNLFDDNSEINVNFNIYNLLYIQGKSHHGIQDIHLSRLSNDAGIEVHVEISCLFTTQFTPWNQGLLIPKSMGEDVKVSIKYIE